MAQFESTPLHMAAEHGQEAAIKALVAANADVRAKNFVTGGRGSVLGWRGGEGGVGFVLSWCGFGF